MDKNMKVGFIGFGHMASAIVQGWLSLNVIEAKQIAACAKHYEPLCQRAGAMGILACKTAEEVMAFSDMVIIAVKPAQVEEVLLPLKELLEEKIIISVAAGISFDQYETMIPHTAHLSMIPNTPIAVGQGICVCEARHSLNETQLSVFLQLFEPVSLIEFVPTSQLSIAGTLCGCAPAFTAMYLEALGDAGVKYGLSRESVYRLASKMIVGTGSLQLATHKHPGVMKDEVCSPKGTTIQGVSKLEEKGFRSAVIAAIDAIEGK